MTQGVRWTAEQDEALRRWWPIEGAGGEHVRAIMAERGITCEATVRQRARALALEAAGPYRRWQPSDSATALRALKALSEEVGRSPAACLAHLVLLQKRYKQQAKCRHSQPEGPRRPQE